jgi:hypothetical protein
MSEATELYINTILSHKEFSGKLRKFFDRYFKDIDEAAKRIPGFLKVSRENHENVFAYLHVYISSAGLIFLDFFT